MSSPQQPPPPSSQAAQAGLAILVLAAIERLWPSLDLLHLRRSLPAFKAAVAQDVQRHAQASATLAARQYRQQRVAAGVGGGYTPRPADPPSVEQVAQAVDWAVQPLWDSSVALQELDAAPEETQKVAGSAIADAKARLAAASEKLVLEAGRDTIIANVERDRKAKAWARIAEPGACSFCAMLTTRGAVYHAQRGDFKAHDNCRCHAEPVFTAYEPPAKVREWQQQYDKVAEQIGYGTDGRVSAKDMRRAFRQSFEGRPVDVTPTGQRDKSKAPPSPRKAGERTQDEVRAELAALESNFSRLATDQQREWTNTRMAALRDQLNQ
jgi:hypothetical protein